MAFEVKEQEWETAKHYLDNAPNGTKLTYSATLQPDGTFKPRAKKDKFYKAIEKHNKKPSVQPLSQISHSFIKLEGKIYAIAQGKSSSTILGQGSFGKVKLIQDSDKKYSAIKKELDDCSATELQILQDRQLSGGRNQIQHHKHSQDKSTTSGKPINYTQMEYLGKSLDSYIKNHNPSAEERVDLAIKLCLEVQDFHLIRKKSKSKTAYAHFDLKLNNATIDDKGKVHLIDFGQSITNPQDRMSFNKALSGGTSAYMPHVSIIPTLYTGEKRDIFALKRSLLFPKTAHNKKELFFDGRQYPLILNRATLQSYPNIEKYVSTNINYRLEKDSLTATSLAAILIAARLNLSIDAEELANSFPKALAVTAIYAHNSVNPKQEIEELFNNKEGLKSTAAFMEMGCYEEFATFMQDKIFAKAMQNACSHEEACVLILLKIKKLDSAFYSVTDKNIIDALYRLHQLPEIYWSKDILEKIIQNPLICRLILELDLRKLESNFEFIRSLKHVDSIDKQLIPVIKQMLSSNSPLTLDSLSTALNSLSDANPQKKLIGILNNQIDAFFTDETDLVAILRDLSSDNQRFLLQSLSSDKFNQLIPNSPPNPAPEQLRIFWLEQQLKLELEGQNNPLSQQFTLLFAEVDKYCTFVDFQNACINTLQQFDEPKIAIPIYEKILSTTEEDKAIFEKFDKEYQTRIKQDKWFSIIAPASFYTAEFFAIVGCMLALAFFAIPILGQLSLLTLGAIAAAIGLTAVLSTYALPKIYQWIKAPPAGDENQPLLDSSAKHMSQLGGGGKQPEPSVENHNSSSLFAKPKDQNTPPQENCTFTKPMI